MQTTTWNGYSLSRLMLGTVQLGMPYGIANRTGQPDYDRARAILAAAADGGVNCLDTAAAYGESEAIVGRALQELRLADRMVVVTKVRALTPAEAGNTAAAARAIEQSVAESRRRLHLDCIPIVLFHREADAVHLDVLEKLKARGWLRHAGVSCDSRPGPAADLAGRSEVGALQIPANILDRRHVDSGAFRIAAAHGVAVFIRSVYLQGLLLMAETSVPEHLRAVLPVRRRLEAIAGAAGMTLAELALRYVLGQRGVTCVLTGVETVEQVKDNIALFERGPLPADVTGAVDSVVPDLPEAVVTPWMWPALADECARGKSV